MIRTPAAALALLLATAAPALAQQPPLKDAIAADYRANLQPLFEHLHRNPELSHREVQTSKRLAAELRSLGYTVTQNVGGTGVVAVLRNGAGPTVMLRADMDALPPEEKNGLTYASKAHQIDNYGG